MPNAKKVNDKTKTTIFVAQNDKAAKWYYTRDNPNGLPQLKKIKIKGKEAWDDTEVMEFLGVMDICGGNLSMFSSSGHLWRYLFL